jgi:PIN domain nuclease of toxin-antitoxin system
MNGYPVSSDSRAAVAAAQAGNLGVYLSPMTAWEIATLVAKSRLRLSLSPEAWFDTLLGVAGVRLAPMSPKVLIAPAGLPGVPPKDPVDLIIAATGRTYGYAVITRDDELRRYARTRHIELVEC